MYLQITGNLSDILGEAARGNLVKTHGLLLKPEYQSFDNDEMITLAEVVDEAKLPQELLSDSRVIVLETDADFDEAIDVYFEEKYTLSDSTALQIALQLSGKTATDIAGYDTTKAMTDKANLKAMHNAGLAGIKKKGKPAKKRRV